MDTQGPWEIFPPHNSQLRVTNPAAQHKYQPHYYRTPRSTTKQLFVILFISHANHLSLHDHWIVDRPVRLLVQQSHNAHALPPAQVALTRVVILWDLQCLVESMCYVSLDHPLVSHTYSKPWPIDFRHQHYLLLLTLWQRWVTISDFWPVALPGLFGTTEDWPVLFSDRWWKLVLLGRIWHQVHMAIFHIGTTSYYKDASWRLSHGKSSLIKLCVCVGVCVSDLCVSNHYIIMK